MSKYETHSPPKTGEDYDRCFSSRQDSGVYYKPLVQSILAMMQFDMGGRLDLVSKRFCQCLNCHESTKRALDVIFTRSDGTEVDICTLLPPIMAGDVTDINILSPNSSPPSPPKTVPYQKTWAPFVPLDTNCANTINVTNGGQGQSTVPCSNPLQLSPSASPSSWAFQAQRQFTMNPAATPFTPAPTCLEIYRAGAAAKKGTAAEKESFGLWPAVSAIIRPPTPPPTVELLPTELAGLVSISVGVFGLKITIEKQWVKSLPYFHAAVSSGQVVSFPDERVDVVACFLEHLITGNYTCHINYGTAASVTRGSAFAEGLFHLAVARLGQHVGHTKLAGDAISNALDLQGRMGSALRLRFWSVLYRRGYKMICATAVQTKAVAAWMEDLDLNYRNHLYAAKIAMPRLIGDMQVICLIAQAGGVG